MKNDKFNVILEIFNEFCKTERKCYQHMTHPIKQIKNS